MQNHGRMTLALFSMLLGLVTSGCTSLHLAEEVTAAGPSSKVTIVVEAQRAVTGRPVRGLEGADFRVLEPRPGGRRGWEPVSSTESRYAITQLTTQRLYTALLLDLSGSIERDAAALASLQEGVREFLSAANPRRSHYVAIWLFDGTRELTEWQGFTDSQATLERRVDALGSFRPSDRSTNLNEAVVLGLERLAAASPAEAEVSRRGGTLIVFTDGRDRTGFVPISEVEGQVSEARASGELVFTIGLGSEVSQRELRMIGQDRTYRVGSASRLGEAFRSIARRLLAGVYEVQYCSPARSGERELSVRSGRGRVDVQFSADGFTAMCELPEVPRHDVSESAERRSGGWGMND